MRLIDKDRLIEELKKELAWIGSYCVRDEDRYIEGAMGGLAKAIDVANQQPTSDGWIPVSERLPEEDVDVLITTSWGALYIAWICKGVWNTDDFDCEDDEVIAWQSLPPTYKESE